MSLILVTGGVRSGKSAWAERLAADLSKMSRGKVTFIATAEITSMEMRLRVHKHKKRRPRSWKTIEAPTRIAPKLLRRARITPNAVFILDSVSHLIKNMIMGDEPIEDIEKAEQALQAELRAVMRLLRGATLIIVTNELGSGIILDDEQTSNYRDVAGRINQWLASQANQIWLVVSGMALPLHLIATPVADDHNL
jgi:adenosylcobinamide kinase/adenosylcobinamide-phosphate guanylyltransferase